MQDLKAIQHYIPIDADAYLLISAIDLFHEWNYYIFNLWNIGGL